MTWRGIMIYFVLSASMLIRSNFPALIETNSRKDSINFGGCEASWGSEGCLLRVICVENGNWSPEMNTLNLSWPVEGSAGSSERWWKPQPMSIRNTDCHQTTRPSSGPSPQWVGAPATTCRLRGSIAPPRLCPGSRRWGGCLRRAAATWS